jgi:hypothetical protein
MPPGQGVGPLQFFRTVVRHERLSERMRGLGAVFLGPRALVPPRLRELLILRTCARCHLISMLVNAVGVQAEPWPARFPAV